MPAFENEQPDTPDDPPLAIVRGLRLRDRERRLPAPDAYDGEGPHAEHEAREAA